VRVSRRERSPVTMTGQTKLSRLLVIAFLIDQQASYSQESPRVKGQENQKRRNIRSLFFFLSQESFTLSDLPAQHITMDSRAGCRSTIYCQMQAREARLPERGRRRSREWPMVVVLFEGRVLYRRYRLLCPYKRIRGDDTFLQRARHRERRKMDGAKSKE